MVINFFPHRLMYCFSIALTFVTVAITVILSIYCVDFSRYVPRLETLINDLWSTLLAAIIIALFIRISNMSSSVTSEYVDERNEEYIKQRIDVIEDLFLNDIKSAARVCDLPDGLLTSILVFEDLNRPKIIRRMENILVRLPSVSLTVGIAQVRSSKPLSDGESIAQMGKYLSSAGMRGYSNLGRLRSVIMFYNPSLTYVDNVLEIIKIGERANKWSELQKDHRFDKGS